MSRGFVEPNTEHPGLLAGVPGFHSLARTSLVGLAGPGSAILDVFCGCDDSAPVAQVTVRLKPKKGELAFVERGRGKITLTPSLDLRTSFGHFVTDPVWDTSPDGWMPIGPIVKGKLTPRKDRSEGRRGRTAKTIVSTTAAEDLCANCEHPRGEHDPCAECARQGKRAKKMCRSFEPKR